MVAAYCNHHVAETIVHEAIVEGDITPASALVVEGAAVDQLEVVTILYKAIRQRSGVGMHQVNLAVVEFLACGGIEVGNFESHTLDFTQAGQTAGRNDDLGVAVVVQAVAGHVRGITSGAVSIDVDAGQVGATHDGSHLGVEADVGDIRRLCRRAVRGNAEDIVAVGVETRGSIGGGGEAAGQYAGVAHVVHGVGGTGVVGVNPAEGHTVVSSCSGEAVDGQTAGHRSDNEGVVLGHTIGVAATRIGVGCSSNRAGVAVEVAVRTEDTHTVAAQSLGGRNLEGGSQRGGIGALALTHIDNLVAIKGQAVVPVNPDDGAVGIASGIGDVHSGGSAGRHIAAHAAVIGIHGRGGVSGVGHTAEADASNTAVVHRSGIR